MAISGHGLLGAIEAGGTKFVLATGHADGSIAERHVIATTTPEDTLAEAARWFADRSPLAAIGIASFGPVSLDRAASDWGHITQTPKPGWVQCDIAGYFARQLGVPIGFDTDVNGAALAEYSLGAGRGAKSLAYVTVGTGIGGGIVLDGKPVHGLAHPEIGHIIPRRANGDRSFTGTCPYHGDCLEGLASGPAIIARWGASLSDLPSAHPAHAIIADYLAQLCHTIFASCAVEVIVLSGGVAKTPSLIKRTRTKTEALGAGYLPGRERHRIERPGLGDDAGVAGALILARDVLAR